MEENLTKEDHDRLYGKPENVVHFMDYTNGQPDNGYYIPNLVPGVLQPLEELLDPETDKFLSTIEIEALVKEPENSTGGIPNNPILPPAEKDLKYFGNITSAEMLKEVSNHSFSAVTKRKAMWAARIFDYGSAFRTTN